jgi:hypothetical protein
MKKKIFIICIIANLFSGQLYAIEHLIEHGFEEHEHNELPCELSIFYDNYKFLDTTNNLITYSIYYTNFSNNIIVAFNNIIIRYIKPVTRAPPNFS